MTADASAAAEKAAAADETKAAAEAAGGASTADKAKSDEYSETMNRKMGTSLHYRHELGIDYNRILPDLIVGSCLQVGKQARQGLLTGHWFGCSSAPG